MNIAGQIIIVSPDGADLEPRLSDDSLMSIAANILGATDTPKVSPTFWTRVLWTVNIAAARYGERVLRDAGWELGQTRPNLAYREDLSPVEKQHLLQDSRALVLALLRGFLRSPDGVRDVFPMLQIISQEEAASEGLRFPIGRPQNGTAYRTHPFDATLLVPVAQFHNFMLQDKKAEFLRIASALGARKIRLVDSESTSRSESAHARIGGLGENFGAMAESSKSSFKTFEIDYESTSTPTRTPFLPDNTRWLVGEPLWQSMAETRISAWWTTSRVSFQYHADDGFTAEIAAGLEGLGFSCGGVYRSQESVHHEYHVEFWGRDAYESHC